MYEPSHVNMAGEKRKNKPIRLKTRKSDYTTLKQIIRKMHMKYEDELNERCMLGNSEVVHYDDGVLVNMNVWYEDSRIEGMVGEEWFRLAVCVCLSLLG